MDALNMGTPSRIISICVPLALCVIMANCYNLSTESLKALSPLADGNGSSNVEWYNPLLQKFRDARVAHAAYEPLLVPSLREKTSSQLTNRLFEPRRTALEDLVAKAESVAKEYDWASDITSVSYKTTANFSQYNEPEVVVEGSNRFSTAINFNFSTVHMPIATYVGDGSVEKETMHGLRWTESLDKLFIDAEEKARKSDDSEDLLWQYFGSQHGFVRHYPGSGWINKDEVDLYDTRRRPWYNQGSSSPKDVLILIDTSGSTLGQTLYLMTLTVQKLVDTLGEDDFVQVANFSDAKRMEANDWNAKIGPDCFPEFVQATTFNKRMIMGYVKALNDAPDGPFGQANFTTALEYAYRTFEKFDKSEAKKKGMGSNCSKIIILLTDGGMEKPHSVISDHEEKKNVKYHTFTYAMGQAPKPLDAVRWLACRKENRGYFSKINSIGTIDTGVQHFTARLGAILAHERGQESLLSSLYRDEWGLGMLMTLTMPVFNKTDPANVTLLGVMGMDVATDEFDKFIPFRELGPLSYIIVVNHNGFVVKHPLLREQQLWDIEPPSIDILDVEVVKNKETIKSINEVRDTLLNGETRSTQIDGVGAVIKNGNNYAYFISHTQKYFMTNIKKTRYRLAMATPTTINKVLKVSYPADQKPNATSLFYGLANDGYEVTISKWNYCEGVFLLNNQSAVLDGFTNLTESNTTVCYDDMINHLLWDASILNSSSLYSLVDNGEVEEVSLTTAGGLSVLYPQSDDEESNFRLESHYSNPATKRAFANSQEFIYTATSLSGLTISIYKALTEEENSADGPYIFGVLGITVNSTILTDALLDMKAEDGTNLCDDTSDNTCLLLDEGGFIIADNSPTDGFRRAGKWLGDGDVDPSLMYLLYNGSEATRIYNRHKFFDYQATCTFNWLEESGAASRLPSLGQLAEMVLTQFTAAISVLYSSIVYSGVSGEEPLKYGEEYHTCTKISYQYYYNNKDNLNREITGCGRKVQTAKVEGTNMMLVISSTTREECPDVSLPHDPVQIEIEDYIEENPSVCQRHLRRRIPPAQCYNDHKPDFPYSCEGCHQATVNLLLIFGALMAKKLFD